MRNAAGHRAERAQALLFHDLLLCIVELVERVLQFVRPRPHLLLELLVQEAALEQVAQAELHLGRVERLRDEIARAGGERLAPRLGRHVRGEHDDRQEHVLRDNLLELLHHLVAVHMRHVQIREHEVGLELRKDRNRLAGIRRATPFQPAENLQHPFEQADI